MNVKQDPTLQGTAQPPPGRLPGAPASGRAGWDLDNDALAHALSWLTRTTGVNARLNRCWPACR